MRSVIVAVVRIIAVVAHSNLDIDSFVVAVEHDDNSFVFDNVVQIVAAIVVAFVDDDMHRTVLREQLLLLLQLMYPSYYCLQHRSEAAMLSPKLRKLSMLLQQLLRLQMLLHQLNPAAAVVVDHNRKKMNQLMMATRKRLMWLSVLPKWSMKPMLLKAEKLNCADLRPLEHLMNFYYKTDPPYLHCLHCCYCWWQNLLLKL